MLAVASLLLLAGVWLLATMSIGRQVGRLAAMATKLGPRRSRRANCPRLIRGANSAG